jgi:hypothetical protein
MCELKHALTVSVSDSSGSCDLIHPGCSQTLLFRVSEKTATPTSVILMAVNTAVGFFAKGLWLGGMSPEAVSYWLVCVPVVTIGAPVGAWAASHAHRLCLAAGVVFADVAQFVIGMWILFVRNPPEQAAGLVALSITTVGIVVGGAASFAVLSCLGERLLALEGPLLHERRSSSKTSSINP